MPVGFTVEGLTAPTPGEVHPVEGCTRPAVAKLRAQFRRKCVLNNDEAQVGILIYIWNYLDGFNNFYARFLLFQACLQFLFLVELF